MAHTALRTPCLIGLSALAGNTLLLTGCAGSSPNDPPPSVGDARGTDDPVQADDTAATLADEIEACVEGRWELKPDEAMWGDITEDLTELSGSQTLVFEPTVGCARLFESFRLYEDLGSGGDVFIDTVWDGILMGDYDIHDDGTVSIEVTSTEGTIHTTNQQPGGVTEDDAELTLPYEVSYECDGDTLTGYAVEGEAAGDIIEVFHFLER